MLVGVLHNRVSEMVVCKMVLQLTTQFLHEKRARDRKAYQRNSILIKALGECIRRLIMSADTVLNLVIITHQPCEVHVLL